LSGEALPNGLASLFKNRARRYGRCYLLGVRPYLKLHSEVDLQIPLTCTQKLLERYQVFAHVLKGVTESHLFRPSAWASKAGYGCHVDILVPEAMLEESPSLCVPIKGLLDGTLTAFHEYSGKDLLEISRRLADRLNDPQHFPASRLQTMLASSHNKLLGKKESVCLRESGIQLSPQDDLCKGGRVRLVPKPSGRRVVLRVRLYQEQESLVGLEGEAQE
jgi:hypothetical protein